MHTRTRLKDVASGKDARGITIQRVGVKDVHLPVRIRRKGGGHDLVLARIDLSVELPEHYRGTHMSRFLEILFRAGEKPISKFDVQDMLAEAREKLDARRAHLDIAFKYFITKRAPATGSESALDYDCLFRGILDDSGFLFTLGVEVPVTLLCPCSKEISARGAHNQRAVVRAHVRYRPEEMVWIEDLVALIETQGSAEIFPLLKRADEKAVTEQAYDNPKFVEDVLRDVVIAFRRDSRIDWFEVECESHESIHNHSVYAYSQESREAAEPDSAPS